LPEYISLEVLEEETNLDLYNIKECEEYREYIFFTSPFYRSDFFVKKMNYIPFNIGFGRSDKVLDNFIENVIIHNDQIFKLYRSIRGNVIWDFFIIGERPNASISAFFKYTIKNDEIFLDGIYEHDWCWNLSFHIIQEYYLKKFKSVLSMNTLEKRGKSFFQLLAKYFIDNKYSVKIYTDKTEYPYEIDKADYYWEYDISNSDYKYIKFENI